MPLSNKPIQVVLLKMAEEAPATADFDVMRQESAKYRFVDFAAVGGSTATITTSGASASFSIGGGQEVLNLARSFLKFTMATAATNAFALVFNKLDCHISDIKLSTSGGQVLADIKYVDRFQREVLPYTMPHDVYHAQPWGDLGTGGTNIEGIAALSPSGGRVLDSGAITTPGGRSRIRALRWDTSVTAGDSQHELAYQGPRYTIGVPRGARANSILFNIPLKDMFPHTVFAVDKDIYVGNERLILDINFAPITRIYAKRTVPTNSGVATNWLGTTAAADVNISVTGLTFQVAIEENPVIATSVKNLFLQGVAFPIDFVTAFRNSNSGTSQSTVVPLSKGMGRRLKFIWWAAFHGTESANTAWNISNVAGAKITSYQTFLNGVPLQLSTLSAAKKDDWRQLYPFYKGKPGVQSFNTFRYNFVHLDSFIAADQLSRESAENLIGRELMDNDLQYMISATTPSATLIWYLFTVTSKIVSAANGVITVS